MTFDLADFAVLTGVVMGVISIVKLFTPLSGRGTPIAAVLIGALLSVLYLFGGPGEGPVTVWHVTQHFLSGAFAGAAAVGLKVGGAAIVNRMPTR